MLNNLKILILHVGTMANKGTQALVKSEFAEICKLYKKVEMSVSTTDVSGVEEYGPRYKNITPTLVDIPYEKADERAKKYHYSRDSLVYKLHAIYRLFISIFQIPLTLISSILVKIGLPGLCKSKTLLCMKECELIISTSDENFKEGSSNLPLSLIWLVTWWMMLFSRMWDLVIAKKIFKKTIIVFPNSVGPFRTIVGKGMGKLILHHIDAVLVRERFSMEAINKLNVKKVNNYPTSDIALLFEECFESKISLKGEYIGICTGCYSGVLNAEGKEKYVNSHAIAFDRFVEKYKVKIAFIPHYISGFPNDDLDVSKQIYLKMKNNSKANVIVVNTADEFRALLGRMKMVITSKMHPGVLALSKYVPTLAIVYDYKQSGLFEQLEMTQYTIGFEEIDEKSLYEKMELTWSNRDQIKNLLRERIPVLQQDVRNNILMVLRKYGGLT